MANTIRVLPTDEWPRLMKLDEDWLEQLPGEGEGVIFVEEDNIGDIIAYWMVTQQYHLEPCWVRPDHRGGMAIKRLFGAIKTFLDTCSISKAFCSTESPEVCNYLGRLGFIEVGETTFEYNTPCHKTQSEEVA